MPVLNRTMSDASNDAALDTIENPFAAWKGEDEQNDAATGQINALRAMNDEEFQAFLEDVEESRREQEVLKVHRHNPVHRVMHDHNLCACRGRSCCE